MARLFGAREGRRTLSISCIDMREGGSFHAEEWALSFGGKIARWTDITCVLHLDVEASELGLLPRISSFSRIKNQRLAYDDYHHS
jgi:hypothetical protein